VAGEEGREVNVLLGKVMIAGVAATGASALGRAAESADASGASALGVGVTQRVLRVPLLAKLLGANLLIAAAALLVHAFGVDANQPLVIASALLASFALNAVLVRIALRPVDEVARVARAIADGNSAARAQVLPTADRRIAGLAHAVNLLLDRAAMDEAQIKRLTRVSLHARETERASLARHLRDTTAQELYALTLQLSAAAELNAHTEAAGSLESARSMAADVTRAVSTLADSVYPGAVGEYAACAAIQGLATRFANRTGLHMVTDLRACAGSIPYGFQVALYCFAEEALRNVELHARATTVRMTATRSNGILELSIEDDGKGFAPAADPASGGIGLFRARELLAHAGGELRVLSSPGSGTTAIARASLLPRTNL
jgi:two-component system sensor histidine kinase UhpB